MAAASGSLSSQSDRNTVREMVKAILILDHSKKPFKFCDIVSNVTPKPPRKKLVQLFIEAKDNLKTMGLILHETKISSNKMYFVTSQTQPLEIMYKYASEEEVSDRILLTFVLAFIFMKNGAVHSDRLFNHLKRLGIYDESKVLHPYFGNVQKKILTEFPEQLYLSLEQRSVDPELYEVKWGKRAEIEMSKRSILEFICKKGFKGKVKPQEHTSHYEQVLMQEERANAPNDAPNDEIVMEEVHHYSDDSDIQEVDP